MRYDFINTNTGKEVPWNIIDADLANKITIKEMNKLNQQGLFLVQNTENDDYLWISTDDYRNIVFEEYYKNSNDTYGV